MGCGRSQAQPHLPEQAHVAGAVILVDVAESLLQQVPVAREVIGCLTSLYEKWKARQDLAVLIKSLGEVLAYIMNRYPLLDNEDDKKLLRTAVERVRNELEPGAVGHIERWLDAEGAKEALREIRADLHLRLQCVNLAVAQPGRQTAQRHQIRRIPASEVQVVINDEVGHGMFRVFRGTYRSRAVAVKAYDLSASLTTEELLARVEKNARLQMDAAHDNILRIYGLCGDSQSLPKKVLLITPFMPAGSMHSMLFPKAEAGADAPLQRRAHEWLLAPDGKGRLCSVLHGIAAALQHMHERRPPVVHLDVKTGNVLMEELPGGDFKPLLHDFDAASEFRAYKTTTAATTTAGVGARGTRCYMAPERRVRGQKDADRPEADIFSFGMLVCEAVNLQLPFLEPGSEPPVDDLDIMQRIHNGERPVINKDASLYEEVFEQLAEDCWKQVPSDRLQSKEVVHRLFSHLCGALPPRIGMHFGLVNQEVHSGDRKTKSTGAQAPHEEAGVLDSADLQAPRGTGHADAYASGMFEESEQASTSWMSHMASVATATDAAVQQELDELLLDKLLQAAERLPNGKVLTQKRLENLKEARKMILERSAQPILEKFLELSDQEVQLGNSELAVQALSHIGWLSRSSPNIVGRIQKKAWGKLLEYLDDPNWWDDEVRLAMLSEVGAALHQVAVPVVLGAKMWQHVNFDDGGKDLRFEVDICEKMKELLEFLPVHISIYKDGSEEELVEEFDTHVDRVTLGGSCAADVVEHPSSAVIVCYWPLNREALRVHGKLRATISRKMVDWQMNEAYECLFKIYSDLKNKLFKDGKALECIMKIFKEALDCNILHEEVKQNVRDLAWDLVSKYAGARGSALAAELLTKLTSPDAAAAPAHRL